MGVLGWPPRVVMVESCLRDLADAWAGYAQWHGLSPASPPASDFLQAMLRQFPDQKE